MVGKKLQKGTFAMSVKNLAEIQLLTDSLSHNIISSVQAELLIKYRYLAPAFGRHTPYAFMP